MMNWTALLCRRKTFVVHQTFVMGFIYSIQICGISLQTFGPSHPKCPTCSTFFAYTGIIMALDCMMYKFIYLYNFIASFQVTCVHHSIHRQGSHEFCNIYDIYTILVERGLKKGMTAIYNKCTLVATFKIWQLTHWPLGNFNDILGT